MPKKLLQGKITSTKMQKTVGVSVEIQKKHKIYKKPVKATLRLLARDDLGCKVGQSVLVEESRPLSKRVTWIVKEILDKKEE